MSLVEESHINLLVIKAAVNKITQQIARAQELNISVLNDMPPKFASKFATTTLHWQIVTKECPLPFFGNLISPPPPTSLFIYNRKQ